MLLILALSVLATVTASPTADVDNPGGTVTCTETGYTPVFTYTPDDSNSAITNVNVDLTVGDGAGGCTHTETNLTQGASNTIDDLGTINFGTCGGVLQDSEDGDQTRIEHVVDVILKVSETTRNIIREYSYNVSVQCFLTRNNTLNGTHSWTVDRENVTLQVQTEATDLIDFNVDINFYKTALYMEAYDSVFSSVISQPIYIMLVENPVSTVFKFVTNKCYWNHVTTNNGRDGSPDVFFDDQCPVDKDPDNNKFDDKDDQNTDSGFFMEVKSFFFTGYETSAVHLFCEIYVCLTADIDADRCVQKNIAQCSMLKKRRRRSIEDSSTSGGPIETRIVESKQMILLDKNDVIVPSCGEEFVYDRVTKGCSNKNLIDIIGVYLDIPWEDDYSDKSSLAYKNLAIEKAYQLYAMVQMSEAKDHIVGLEVIDAKKGSVILTVRVMYSAMSNADAAYEGFMKAIETVDQSRVANILNIRKEKVIEFVQVKPASGGVDQNLTVIIVVVVVLLVAVLISILAVWKVKVARGSASHTMQVKAHDNPTMVTVN